MQKQDERDIAGLRIHSRQLTPMRAYRLLARLGQIAGPISHALKPESLARIKAGDYAAAVPVAMSVFTSLTEEQAEALALAALAGTAVDIDGDGKRLLQCTGGPQIDAAFAGNLKAMLGAILFALEVNYKDFFSGLGQPGAKPETPTPSL